MKTKIRQFLQAQQQPVPMWDVARAIYYSGAHTREALREMTAAGEVEAVAPTCTAPSRDRSARRSQLYRLIPPSQGSGPDDVDDGTESQE